MKRCQECVAACHGDGSVENASAALAVLPTSTKAGAKFRYSPMFQVAPQAEQAPEVFTAKSWKKLPGDFVDVLDIPLPGGGTKKIVSVKKGTLAHLAHQCIIDVQHFFRRDRLQAWANIIKDPEASANDVFVAKSLLQNACIAAGQILPSCQDTGTAIVHAHKGESVWTEDRDDEEGLSHGIWLAYQSHSLRYSQTAALDMFEETNTKSNLPAQLDIHACKGSEYHFLVVAKGGGSANKSLLFQETKALLNEKSLRAFIKQKLATLGTAACPPYTIALVIGGTSAEATMQTVKMASCRYYDELPTTGDEHGRAFRDPAWEKIVLEEAAASHIGAQFGGKYFAHQARVIRLPRHGASCPVGLGVSCSADRQILAKITAEGVFMEELEYDPAAFLPADDVDDEKKAASAAASSPTAAVKIDLNMGMDALRKELSKYPIKTRLSLTGDVVVARDIAHAKILERLESGLPLPDYFKNYVIFYAGPAKIPQGYASGSFGPTTAGRMDSYVDRFQKAGGSFVTLAKGNRSKAVTDACKNNCGFYIGTVGGAGAILAKENITKVETIDYPELGMEAVWKITVVDFPSFLVVDDKGNDFFAQS